MSRSRSSTTSSSLRLAGCAVGRREHREFAQLAAFHGAAAQHVDRAVAGDRHQPAARIGRHAVRGPALERERQRLLGAVLGQGPVAGDPDQRRRRSRVRIPRSRPRRPDGRRVPGRGRNRRPQWAGPRTGAVPNGPPRPSGARGRPRSPRPGRRSRGCRSPRSPPWSRRTGRRRRAARRRVPGPWWPRTSAPAHCPRAGGPLASFSATHTSMSGICGASVSGSVSVQTNIMYFICFAPRCLDLTTVTNGGRGSGHAVPERFRTPPAVRWPAYPRRGTSRARGPPASRRTA